MSKRKITLGELAEHLQAELVGDKDLEITGAGGIEDVSPGGITFVEDPKWLPQAEKSPASAIIVPQEVTSCCKPILRTPHPRLAFALTLGLFFPPERPAPGIHPTAIVGGDLQAGEAVSVGPYSVIGDGVILGKRVVIHPLVSIGDGVKIGDDTLIYPRVAIYRQVEIGARVIIHAGAVIGSDGFGFTPAEGKHHKIPQVGTVVVGDDVEIGANTVIDRAATGATTIGRGTKIDNLAQIAHNVTIGEDCIVIAQVGISGSVRICDRAVLAGQAGLKDHITIGEGAVICAQAGVIGDIPPGVMVSGYPARPHREQMKLEATLPKVPEMLKTVRNLEKRIRDLEQGKES